MTTSIYDVFETKEVSEDGKWFDLGDGMRIQLRYMGSKLSQKSYEDLMRPFAPRQKLGIALTEEESKKINAEFLAGTLVLNWENFKDRDGKNIKYTQQAVASLCEALPRLAALILQISMDESNFEKELVEEEVGNSPDT